ncbi:MAG: hypothetical protein Q9195_000446 [Heterodermia aff. obscurata]
MRRVKIFSGSSHPLLVDTICERLGISPAKAELKKFSNGETSVSIETSIREQDVFIVQSGSRKINDSVIELLIMISACKSGSAKSITAVMPYFPYSRQSKKKSHRGAITARLFANLLSVAGVHHVITVDLHAPPTQGFFGQPVDNLHAEPLIARWIRTNVPGWKEAVVVSKNPGGTKRVTSMADALKLNFGMVTTDRRRTDMHGSNTMMGSGLLPSRMSSGTDGSHENSVETDAETQIDPTGAAEVGTQHRGPLSPRAQISGSVASSQVPARGFNEIPRSSPLFQSIGVDSVSPPTSRSPSHQNIASPSGLGLSNDVLEEYTDERAREVITGRLIQGHIVDDNFPSPLLSTMSGSLATLPDTGLGPSHYDNQPVDPMTSSIISNMSAFPSDHALGGTGDARDESDEEEGALKNPEVEHTITLVGDVKDKVVLIIDDLIDQSGSWIAAAETVVKRGGAKKAYCIATHGLFGNDSLEKMEECQCIDYIVVTNTYPIEPERMRACKKLVVLDISKLISEAIRRNHYGESISALFQHYQD